MRRAYCAIFFIQCIFLNTCLGELTVEKKQEFLNSFIESLNNQPDKSYVYEEGVFLDAQKTVSIIWCLVWNIFSVSVITTNIVSFTGLSSLAIVWPFINKCFVNILESVRRLTEQLIYTLIINWWWINDYFNCVCGYYNKIT